MTEGKEKKFIFKQMIFLPGYHIMVKSGMMHSNKATSWRRKMQLAQGKVEGLCAKDGQVVFGYQTD